MKYFLLLCKVLDYERKKKVDWAKAKAESCVNGKCSKTSQRHSALFLVNARHFFLVLSTLPGRLFTDNWNQTRNSLRVDIVHISSQKPGDRSAGGDGNPTIPIRLPSLPAVAGTNSVNRKSNNWKLSHQRDMFPDCEGTRSCGVFFSIMRGNGLGYK